jgi:hypothetical protein
MAAQDIEYVELYTSDHASVLDYLVSSLTFIPVLMRQNLQRLLDHGYSARVMRDDIDAQELLIMVSAVTGTRLTGWCPA